MSTELIYFGSAVKALGNGKVGGYLVEFSDVDSRKGAPPDLTKEFFTKETDYDIEGGDKKTVYFDHGLDPVLKRRKLSKAELKVDDVGVWAETVLDIRDKYLAKIYEMVEKGVLGWSSGSASHLVEKKKSASGFVEITAWPIVEASLTHTPANPYSSAVPLKSFIVEPETVTTLAAKLNKHIEDLVDDGRDRNDLINKMAAEAGVEVKTITEILEGGQRPSNARLKAFARALDISYESLLEAAKHDYAQSVKGMFANALAERTPSRWELESAYSDILSKMMAAAVAARMAGEAFEWRSKFRETTQEYAAVLEDHALEQGESYLASETNEPFYLKAIIDLEKDLSVSGSLDLDDHSQLVVSALREVTKRFRVNHENRVKSGRVLSEKNRTRLSTLLTQMQSAIEDVQNLLDESQPMASEEEKNAALSTFLRLQRNRGVSYAEN